jgi:hypothetical protein
MYLQAASCIRREPGVRIDRCFILSCAISAVVHPLTLLTDCDHVGDNRSQHVCCCSLGNNARINDDTGDDERVGQVKRSLVDECVDQLDQ